MGGPGLGRCIAYYICYSPLEERKSILFPPSCASAPCSPAVYRLPSPFEAATIYKRKGSAAARDNNIARLLFVRRRASTVATRWKCFNFKTREPKPRGFAGSSRKALGRRGKNFNVGINTCSMVKNTWIKGNHFVLDYGTTFTDDRRRRRRREGHFPPIPFPPPHLHLTRFRSSELFLFRRRMSKILYIKQTRVV